MKIKRYFRYTIISVSPLMTASFTHSIESPAAKTAVIFFRNMWLGVVISMALFLMTSVDAVAATIDDVLINEFMASNDSTLADDDGDYSDWIELWNPLAASVDVGGWYLTDDPLDLTKWALPAKTLAPNEFLVIFASSKDRSIVASEWHTSFKMDKAAGGYLALTRPDGQGGVEVVSEFVSYPEQYEDVSFGYYGVNPILSEGYFLTPTPGLTNDTNALVGFVKDTSFDMDRGFYDAPFQLTISSDTPGATILYTTDGSLPTESPLNGFAVLPDNGTTPPSATLTISTTTNVRAMAFKSGYSPTNVDTHTYLFAQDILQQGAPSQPYVDWGHTEPDWSMDPDVVNHASLESRAVESDFKGIPTVSLTMPFADMWGSGGIYISGEGVPKDCSVEFINPDGDPLIPNGKKGYQMNGTVQITGGTSTNRWKSDKLSMRLKFSPDLKYDFFDSPKVPFGNEATDRFDSLILDARLNQSWTHPDSTQRGRGQYVRDQFMADSQNALGGVAPHGRHVHLFIDGIYWGLHTLHERPDDNFAAEYLGGDNEGYDSLKHNYSTVVHGTNTSYLALSNLLTQDLTDPVNYSAVEALLDVEDFAHYMVLNYWAGNADWSHQNWYASCNQNGNQNDPSGRWRFHSWDAEHVLKSPTQDSTTKNDSRSPTGFQNLLMTSPEYKLVFADAVRREFFNGGLLTPAVATARYQNRIDMINEAIRCESARWGDNRRTTPYTRGVEWLDELDYLKTTYLTSRTETVMNQFLSRGWYPETDAPEFNQHGGDVYVGFKLQMTSADGGTILYTLDGSDPRVSGEAVSGNTIELISEDATKYALMPQDAVDQQTWMNSGYNHSTWAAGTLGAGYENNSSGGYNTYLDANLDFSEQVDSTNQETLYMRIPFDVTNADTLNEMTLYMRHDDGFVAYLNGKEILRQLAPGVVDVPLAWNASASIEHADASAVNFVAYDVSSWVGELRDGVNVLAIHGLNLNSSSSDFLIWPTLIASPEAAVNLFSSKVVSARVYNNGEWSALTRATFVVGALPADSENLVISEIHYRPASPSPSELAAGYNKRSDFEFIELTNIGSTPINMTGVVFTSGIDFNFTTHSSILQLESGRSVLIVKNKEAFMFRYGTQWPVVGEFQNGSQLSNGGETITLLNTTLAEGYQTVRDFAYDDVSPWPTVPDGEGFSLTLIAPSSNPDHALAVSWQGSVSIGGSPGGLDAGGFNLWAVLEGVSASGALGDDDDDRLLNLAEYAMLTSPTAGIGNGNPVMEIKSLMVEGVEDWYATIRFRVNKGAYDIDYTVQSSTDLETWIAAGPVVQVLDLGDGSELVTVRSVGATTTYQQQFMRVMFELN